MLRIIPKFCYDTPSPLEVILRIPKLLAIVEPFVTNYDAFNLQTLVQAVADSLPGFMEKRMEDSRHCFKGLIAQNIQLDDSLDPFALAVGSWFTCEYCRAQQSFPAILGHQCSYRKDMIERQLQAIRAVLKGALPPLIPDYGLLLLEGFQAEVEAVNFFVCAYGLNPQTATATDMDNANVRLMCTHNSTYPGRVSITTWRSAVRTLPFALSGCFDGSVIPCQFKHCRESCQYEVLTGEDVVAAKSLEDVHNAANTTPCYSTSKCARCAYTSPNQVFMQNHLRQTYVKLYLCVYY